MRFFILSALVALAPKLRGQDLSPVPFEIKIFSSDPNLAILSADSFRFPGGHATFKAIEGVIEYGNSFSRINVELAQALEVQLSDWNGEADLGSQLIKRITINYPDGRGVETLISLFKGAHLAIDKFNLGEVYDFIDKVNREAYSEVPEKFSSQKSIPMELAELVAVRIDVKLAEIGPGRVAETAVINLDVRALTESLNLVGRYQVYTVKLSEVTRVLQDASQYAEAVNKWNDYLRSPRGQWERRRALMSGGTAAASLKSGEHSAKILSFPSALASRIGCDFVYQKLGQ